MGRKRLIDFFRSVLDSLEPLEPPTVPITPAVKENPEFLVWFSSLPWDDPNADLCDFEPPLRFSARGTGRPALQADQSATDAQSKDALQYLFGRPELEVGGSHETELLTE